VDGGELLVALVSGVIAVIYWWTWLRVALRTTRLVRPRARLIALLSTLLASAAVVLATLLTLADPVVRDDIGYILLFMAVAGLTLAGTTATAALLGASALDDAVRRPNPAAVCVVAGIWLGTGLCVSGANIGRGDTIGTTLGPLVMAVAALMALWGALGVATGAIYSATAGRDWGTGIRLFALPVAWGLILGRAVAGDWESTPATLYDFVMNGWPAGALLGVALLVETILRPSRAQPKSPIGTSVLIAILYLAVAAGWVWWQGRP
jgi:hypothetical protein